MRAENRIRLKPVEVESLVQRTADTIRDHVAQSGLKVGDRLPTERSMAGAMLVSRVTIREALAMLEAVGLIRRRRGHRPIVAAKVGPARSNVARRRIERELTRSEQLRAAVQCGAAAYACARRTKAQLKKLRAIMARFERKCLRGVSFGEEDAKLHSILFECAGPPFAAVGEELMREHFRLRAEAHPENMGPSFDEATLREHHEIVDALERRDFPALARLLLPPELRHVVPGPPGSTAGPPPVY